VKIEFGRDWSEFLRLLISNRVRFVLVGGHAVAGHGEPRLTEDLDVLVEANRLNARRLRNALVEFGFGDAAPSIVDLAERGKIWMLGRKPWRIDILTEIDGVEFSDVWRGRIELPFTPGPLPVIGLTELIANKTAAGRPKDLADVAALEALHAGSARHLARRPRAAEHISRSALEPRASGQKAQAKTRTRKQRRPTKK
jgi:hypothetical protein